MSTADVYRGAERAGTLTRTRAGAVFEYDAELVERAPDGEAGIAFHLPYEMRRIETRGVNLHTFFAGLLPEGIRMRALVRRTKASEDDLLTLLVAAGSDCIGDVSVVAAGERLRESAPSVNLADTGRVSFDEVLARSLESAREPTIPGVQDKVSAAMISLPIRSSVARPNSSFILKLNPKSVPLLVENELFFMTMARACGIECARVEIVRDMHGASGLLVRRFDREGTRKIHQEDACQLCDVYPADKYNLSAADVMRSLEVCSAPIVSRARLLRLFAFSYAIGNGDLHGKNVSVYVNDGRVELTPAYDVLSTLPYGDTHMALKLDGKDDNLRRTSFASFGERHGVRKAAVTAMLDEIVENARPFLSRLGEIGFDAKKTKHLERVIRKRLGDLE
jgi:serine/threonine-protein kinase HipA